MIDEKAPAPWAGIPPTGEMLRVPEAARRIGYSKAGYYHAAAKGRLPKPIKIGRGQTGVSVVPVVWLDALVEHAMRSAEQ